MKRFKVVVSGTVAVPEYCTDTFVFEAEDEQQAKDKGEIDFTDRYDDAEVDISHVDVIEIEPIKEEQPVAEGQVSLFEEDEE